MSQSMSSREVPRLLPNGHRPLPGSPYRILLPPLRSFSLPPPSPAPIVSGTSATVEPTVDVRKAKTKTELAHARQSRIEGEEGMIAITPCDRCRGSKKVCRVLRSEPESACSRCVANKEACNIPTDAKIERLMSPPGQLEEPEAPCHECTGTGSKCLVPKKKARTRGRCIECLRRRLRCGLVKRGRKPEPGVSSEQPPEE